MTVFKSYLGIMLFFISFFTYSQNLLDTSTWTIGSGNVGIFYSNGSASENVRELGENHVGEEVVLWKAIPDASNNSDGGWNSNHLTIDNTKKYRLSVWIKKTNSNDGTTYFGCQQWRPDNTIHYNTVMNLNNSVNRNPYFWTGDLPKLDRWYLLIGFIHGKNASTTTNEGAIYDGATGEFVQNVTDFKFNASTTHLRHRAYLYYDTNTSDRQYFYAPRMEQINGNELTVNQLLSLNPNSELSFTYDNAGNQSERFYCLDACGSTSKNINEKEADEIAEVVEPEEDNLEEQLTLFPNPTKGIVTIKIASSILKKIESINVYNSGSVLVKSLKTNNQNLQVDLSEMPSGMYFLHMHMSDNSKSITKKIIKE